MKAVFGSMSLILMLGVVAGSTPAGAQPSPCPDLTPIVLAGQTNLAFIDVNHNGMRDAGDCIVTGVGQLAYDATTGSAAGLSGTQNGTMCFSAAQGSPPFIVGCNDSYPGSGFIDPSSQSGMTSEDSPGDVQIAYSNSGPSPSPSPSPAIGGPSGVNGFPVPIMEAEVFDENGPVGEGFLCNDGGLAIRATIRGVSGVGRFDKRNIGGVVHACSSLPFPTTTEGTQFFPLCIPIGTGSSALGGLQGGDTFVQFPLTGLSACGSNRAPTANEWGLLGLAGALLAVGTWVLRRRPAFGAALPTV